MSALPPPRQTSPGNQKRISELVRAYPFTFPPETTVEAVVSALRAGQREQLVVYIYVLDPERRMLGVVAMRDLLLSDGASRLSDVMLKSAFSLKPDMPLLEAMRSVLGRHFPIYPVCEADGRFLGVVRGGELFEQQTIEITAQAGEMVGVDAEERIDGSPAQSIKHRHPWLQVNLLTGFVSAAVVHNFEGIIAEYVILAVFLPVMTGQAINIGCQALAVTLRGMTLGQVPHGSAGKLVRKETLLGVLNGGFSGLTAAAGIWAYAAMKGDPNALTLAALIFVAMTAASLVSGLAGATVPLILKKFGTDPANASSIFLTTIAEVAAIAAFLGLARSML